MNPRTQEVSNGPRPERAGRVLLAATSTFGLESLVADELLALGVEELSVENGQVRWWSTPEQLVRACLELRVAERVLLVLGETPPSLVVDDFEVLYQLARRVDWASLAAKDTMFHVVGRSVDSRITSVPACQRVVKRAIIDAMRQRHGDIVFPETGPEMRIEIALLRDRATLTLDATGAALHKRGYRREQGEAPLKETLAAGILRLARYPQRSEHPLVDPCCGSGTFLIEGAQMALGIAPGLHRDFQAEHWGLLPAELWREARGTAMARAEAALRTDARHLRILGRDADPSMVALARRVAADAGLGEVLRFEVGRLEDFTSEESFGLVVCNPPYGERIQPLGERIAEQYARRDGAPRGRAGGERSAEDPRAVEELYRAMGRVYSGLDRWSWFTLTTHEGFEELFGQRASKKRKLFNGNLKCWLYQHFGPLPRRGSPVRAQ